MPEFIDEDELEGRTIAKILHDGNGVYFRFTDGSVSGLVARAVYQDTEIEWDEPEGDVLKRLLDDSPRTKETP